MGAGHAPQATGGAQPLAGLWALQAMHPPARLRGGQAHHRQHHRLHRRQQAHHHCPLQQLRPVSWRILFTFQRFPNALVQTIFVPYTL